MGPCDECLKYSICIGQHEIKCIDLVNWLLCRDEERSRMYEFENHFWNKDLAIVQPATGVIVFKFVRDDYSCLIA